MCVTLTPIETTTPEVHQPTTDACLSDGTRIGGNVNVCFCFVFVLLLLFVTNGEPDPTAEDVLRTNDDVAAATTTVSS